MRKYFGTDGVRGVANSELTCELAFRLGRAGGHVLAKGKEKIKVVVGKDTRVSGDMLESSLIAGLMSTGCDIIQVGVMPTPAIAYLTKKYGADCGVVISASHNPVEFNGIKFFNENGYKLDDEIEIEIESYIDNICKIDYLPTGNKVGKIICGGNAFRDYVDYLKEITDINLKNLKVVLDCANGASFGIAPTVFMELGAEVITIHNNPNGENINDNCGSMHPEDLQKTVVKFEADLGLAYDGDADRLIAVNDKGEIVDGDKIMMISALYLKKKGQLNKNTIVSTVMSNIGFTLCAKENSMNTVATSVGDRYVLEEMMKSGYNLGGEQSGHIIFLDYNTTGDGVLASLILAKIITEEGKKLSELDSVIKTYPQVLVNAKIDNKNKNRYLDDKIIIDEIDKIEKNLEGKGRVLIRPSGTEPLIRVMLEGQNQTELQKMATDLAKLMENRLNK